MNTRILLLALLASAALSPAARAAESFDNCAGYITTVPTVISTQGVWCMDADIATAINSGAAITISANNVTVDCNGFKLGGLAAGPSTGADGIQASTRQNITVRNCNIRGFLRGIYLSSGGASGHLVEDNRLDGNLYAGIMVEGSQHRVQRNLVYDTGSGGPLPVAVGIYAFGDVIENTVDGVESSGFATGILIGGPGTVARNNQVRGIVAPTTRIGINVSEFQVAVIGNVIANVPTGIGRGIWGNGVGGTFCAGNMVAGFSDGNISFCTDSGGNSTH